MDAGAVGIETVERAARRQRFELALVDQPRIDTGGEIVDALERTVGAALDDELLHRPLAHRLQRGERVADGEAAVLGRLDVEFGVALVDVGAADRHAQPAHVVDEDAELVGLRHVVAHRRGVEFLRMMRLQPRRLIGEQRIGGGVALVEAIAGELVDQVEQFVRLGLGDAVHLGAALDEDRALRVHLRLDLLAHRAAQQIGAAEREAGEDLRRLHHLFLVDEDAVGLGQDRFEQVVRIDDRLGALLAAAEARDIVHRAGAVERDERDDVAEIGRAHRAQRAAHALRFELEHADRVALLEQFVDRLVVPQQGVEIDGDAALGEQLHRLLEHRQGLEAEEVELHQPRALDVLHVELGDGHVRPRVAVERHELRERPVADHHAGGVRRGMARQPFELGGEVEQAADLIVVGIFLRQLGHAVERALEVPRIGRMVGDQLGEAIDLAIAHLEHAAGVLEHRARLQFTEGDDLRDLIAAVFLLHVADDLATPGFAEVDVEVGHRDAFRVEEAFEQQTELHRIEIGDGQRPGDHRAGARTTPRPHGNVVILRPFDEVADDQEIAGEAHLDDDVDLEGEPLAIGVAPVRVIGGLGAELLDPVEPFFQTRRRLGAQHRRLALAVAGEAGQDRLAIGRHHRAALGDDQGIVDRLGQVGEQLPHRLGGLEPGVGTGADAILALDIGRMGDAQHRVMRVEEVAVREAAGVRRDQRQVALIGEVDQRLFGRLFDHVATAGELDIEAVGEQRLQPVEIGGGPVGLVLVDQPGERALAARGQRDQPVAAPFERGEVDMRRQFDRAFEMREADQRAQIVIAALVLRIERDPVERRGDAVGHARPRDAQHRPDHRLDAVLLGGIGKGHRGVEAVAIGEAGSRKAHRLGLFGDRLGLDRPVEHRVGRENAERYETGMSHCGDLAAPP